MTVQFLTGNSPIQSQFLCTLNLIPDNCECGKQNAGRIVSGNEVGTKIIQSVLNLCLLMAYCFADIN